jgi:hypothetical protein
MRVIGTAATIGVGKMAIVDGRYVAGTIEVDDTVGIVTHVGRTDDSSATIGGGSRVKDG